jgi:hypothetical protein
MKKIDERVVLDRLIKFLLKDKIGIRKYFLEHFLQSNYCTTVEMYDFLLKQGFIINYRAVSSMLGQMHSRLGILRIDLAREHNVYSIKEDYLDIVKKIIPFSTGIQNRSYS